MNFPASDLSANMDGGASFGGKENQVFARFIRDLVPDPYQSKEQGKPCYKAIDMVEIRQIGEKDTYKEPVNDLHKQRFRRAWDQFSAGAEQMASGSPLAILFPTQPEVVENLKGYYIFTIEALAEVPDSSGAKIPFLTIWKERARQYLDGVEKGKGFHSLEKKLEEAELRNMEMEDRLKTLEAALAEKAPRGRKPSEPEQE